MEKSQASYYLRRIYRLLNTEQLPTIFAKLRGAWGNCNWKKIKLDPRRPILPTFIHECLHNFYPNANETVINNLESQIINKLTMRQLNNLLLRLALAINNLPQP